MSIGLKLKLPDGWTFETLEGSGKKQVIRRPDGCAVTVDFDQRCFRGGWTRYGRANGPRKLLSGRGWRQTLVDAAVAWLEAV